MKRLYGSKRAYLTSTDEFAQNICDMSDSAQAYIDDCLYEHDKAGKPIHDKSVMPLRGKWAIVQLSFSVQFLIFGHAEKKIF